MISPIVLVVASGALRAAGWLGLRTFAPWPAAVRGGLAAMFVVTGTSHFCKMKHDFAAMIPKPLPSGLAVVYLTGALEIAGALGLLIPRLRKPAAIGLTALLLAMFPANVNAASRQIQLAGRPPTRLAIRLPMQLLYIVALGWSALRSQD